METVGESIEAAPNESNWRSILISFLAGITLGAYVLLLWSNVTFTGVSMSVATFSYEVSDLLKGNNGLYTG